jgi:hypothetical protein
MAMRSGDLLRYALWGGLLATANANRVHFGLPSTWVFHTIGNTISLLLPELYGGLSHAWRLDERAGRDDRGRLAAFHSVMRELVRDNPRYVGYVAPLAVGYLVSHPKFNIYKGEWAERQFVGFGLDSIPHATTAFALTRLIFDTLDALTRHLPSSVPAADSVQWAQAHADLISGTILAVGTAAYETSEWLIHNAELRATGGDASKINMEWSVEDTVTDVLSNMIGWLLAVVHQRTQVHQTQAEGLGSPS